MNLTSAEQALQLPHGTLELVHTTPTGRVCEVSAFSTEDVLDTTTKLLKSDVELVEIYTQAEIIALVTNLFGWKGYNEAYAVW